MDGSLVISFIQPSLSVLMYFIFLYGNYVQPCFIGLQLSPTFHLCQSSPFSRLAVFLWQGNGDRLHLSVSFQTIFTQLTTLYFDSKSILSKCFGTKMIYFLYLAGHLISSKWNLKKHHHQLLLQLFMIYDISFPLIFTNI